jgi:hypothetical protein
MSKEISLIGNIVVAVPQRRFMKTRNIALLLFCLALGSAASAQSRLTLYDDFSQQFINPAKWSTQWQCGSPSILECEREIQSNQLRLRVRGYGTPDTNNGNQFGVSGVYLTSAQVSDIQAQVVVRTSTADTCVTNTDGAAHAQVLLTGAFFNGGGGTPDDDVQAFLQLDRYSTESPGVVEAGGFLRYQGQFFGNVDLGPVNVGERVIVEISWDQRHHQFVISLTRPEYGMHAEQIMPYVISDTNAAVAPFKSLSANIFPANCMGSRPSADLEVLFDNVRTK